MKAAAQWGGRYAPTSMSEVAVRCHRCGTATALTVDGDRFACRDTRVCDPDRYLTNTEHVRTHLAQQAWT